MPVISEATLGDLAEDADAALRQLYSWYAPSLSRYVERFGPDLASTDDIVQETFIRAWRHLPQLAADDRLVRPWLFRVARNLVIDAARAARSRPVTVEGRPDLDFGHDDESGQIMDRQLVADALRKLSPAHRAVLVESFYRGGTTEMIARQLGIPHGTARSRLHYALNALRQQLQDPGRPQPHQAAA
ncbi:MAG TPA: sigma-70 family RNA polymerase sigma factor [Streptosporangiaceae bacterium]|nr:sigma-70 family RNA polymerase sigma factor [Streptosporangiaceae bacterium]